MRQGQFRGQDDVFVRHLIAPLQSGMSLRAAQDDQVGAVAVHVEGRHQPGDGQQVAARIAHGVDAVAGAGDALRQLKLAVGPLAAKAVRVHLEGDAPLDDVHALVGVFQALDLHREGEAV